MAAKMSASKLAVWIIIGLLLVGLAGFGTTNFGGGTGAIGFVGEHEISADAYARALRQELRAAQAEQGRTITVSEARATGLDTAVLGRVVTAAALDGEAERLGLSAGDARVAAEVVRQPAFQGAAGFDRAAYADTLRRNGYTEAEFEAEIRSDAARSLLQTAVAGGIEAPAAFSDAILRYARETRDATWAPLPPEALPAPVGAPDEATLASWYAANAEGFTIPETRAITYAWLRPEALVDEVTIPEGAARALYDERIGEYVRPPQRIVERLVFPDVAAAQAAADAIAAGTSDFDAAVAARGLAPEDVDLGAVTEADLGPAGAAVFALPAPGVAGPTETPLGPALFRVDTILDGAETPFEAVEAELTDEAAIAAARRAAEGYERPIGDLLAGGATLEDLAAETPAKLGTIRWAGEQNGGLASYAEFREAAQAAQEGNFPEVIRLSDGGLLALRVDAVEPPRVPELGEVRAAATEAWRRDAEIDALRALGADLAARAAAGEDLAALGLAPRAALGLTRGASLEGAPEGLVDAAFEMAPGEVRVFDDGASAALLRVDAAAPPDLGSVTNQAIAAAVSAQVQAELTQDAFAAYARALQARAGIEIDASAIAAVQAQLP